MEEEEEGKSLLVYRKGRGERKDWTQEEAVVAR